MNVILLVFIVDFISVCMCVCWCVCVQLHLFFVHNQIVHPIGGVHSPSLQFLQSMLLLSPATAATATAAAAAAAQYIYYHGNLLILQMQTESRN